MKSILGHPEIPRSVNLQAISSYLSFRTVVGEGTVFATIKRLLPGHHLTFENGSLKVREYWDVPVEADSHDRGEKYYVARVRELFGAAVAAHW